MPLARPSRRALVVLAGAAAVLLAGCAPADAPTGLATAPRRSVVAATDGAPGTRLLSCATTVASAEASAPSYSLLGPLGGIIRRGGHAVRMPLGALLALQLFSVAEVPGELVAVDVHAVGLEIFHFHRPITVTVDYSRCGDVQGPLRAWHIDPATRELLEDMGGVTDTVRRTHTFQTTHLSVYAMAN
jgi:hypothetical protein